MPVILGYAKRSKGSRLLGRDAMNSFDRLRLYQDDRHGFGTTDKGLPAH